MDTMTQEMRDVKVEDLEGAALAWAAARATGDIAEGESLAEVFSGRSDWWLGYEPQEDWAQAGELISRQRISLSAPGPMGVHWSAHIDTGSFGGSRYWFGDTPLLAACRALAGTVLGEFVSVPAALLEVE